MVPVANLEKADFLRRVWLQPMESDITLEAPQEVKKVFDHLSDHHQLGAENPVDEEKLQTSDHEGTKYEAVG